MSALSIILEEARHLQERGLGVREALAMAMANQRRAVRISDTSGGVISGKFLAALPSASCLDAQLPRDREPTLDEIRAAWQACIDQACLCQGSGP